MGRVNFVHPTVGKIAGPANRSVSQRVVDTVRILGFFNISFIAFDLHIETEKETRLRHWRSNVVGITRAPHRVDGQPLSALIALFATAEPALFTSSINRTFRHHLHPT